MQLECYVVLYCAHTKRNFRVSVNANYIWNPSLCALTSIYSVHYIQYIVIQDRAFQSTP